MSINWLDAIVALLIGAGAFRGLKRGLIREGLAFAGLAAGLVLASEWHHEVAAMLKPFVGGGSLVNGLAYLLVILAILGIATLLTVVLRRLARLLLVGWLDRLGGILIGGAQGAVMAVLLLFLMVKYPILGTDRAVNESETGRPLLALLPPALAYLPPELSGVAEFFEVSQ